MYTKGIKGWMKHWDFMLLGIICLNIAFTISYMIRHGLSNPYANRDYLEMAVILTLLDIVVSIMSESYKNVLKRGYYREFAMTARHVFLVLLLVTGILFATKKGEIYSRTTIYLWAAIYFGLSYILRLVWKHVLRKSRPGRRVRSLLVMTTSDRVGDVFYNISTSRYANVKIVGVVLVDESDQKKFYGVPVVADKDSVLDYVCRKWVDEVFIGLPQQHPYPGKYIDAFLEMGVTVHLELGGKGRDGCKKLVEKMGNCSVLTMTVNYATALQACMKRLVDIGAGLVGCLVTLLLCIIIGPVIYIKSPGPIFFSQTRIGKNGKPFKIYKFRSMYMDAEERKKELMAQNRVSDGMMFKLDWDPRIIGSKKLPDGTLKKGIGNYIRDWSLDEFPQFLNVLLGSMSLVGTRPPTKDEWEKYEYHHRARLAVKPGITGMWQVSGRSNITDFEEVVRLDMKYITDWSIGMDLRIIAKTVKVVLGKEGSM